MNWAEVSVVHYADAQLREFVKDLLEAIPATQTSGEAMEIAATAASIAGALLHIRGLAETRATRLRLRDGR